MPNEFWSEAEVAKRRDALRALRASAKDLAVKLQKDLPSPTDEQTLLLKLARIVLGE